MLVNYLSQDNVVNSGEMRKAIAGSIIVVYFALLSLFAFRGISYTDQGIAKTIIEHFTHLVEIVVIFYFGSKAVMAFAKNKKGGNETG